MIVRLGPDTDCDTREQLFRGYLQLGWCIAINGVDFEFQRVTTEGFYLKRWDEEAGSGTGEEIHIIWEDVNHVLLY